MSETEPRKIQENILIQRTASPVTGCVVRYFPLPKNSLIES